MRVMKSIELAVQKPSGSVGRLQKGRSKFRPIVRLTNIRPNMRRRSANDVRANRLEPMIVNIDESIVRKTENE